MSYDESVGSFGMPRIRERERGSSWFTPSLVLLGAAAILFLTFGPTERVGYNYCPTDGRTYKIITYMGRKDGSPPTVTTLNPSRDSKELEGLRSLKIKCPPYK